MNSAKVPSRLSVAIPGSLVSDTPHLREKTAKLGVVARACSIFGVHEIMLYPDESSQSQRSDLQLCAEILGFIETPQYLRKRLYGMTPSLRFAGILPPLQIPSHDVVRTLRECNVNDFREGVVISNRGEYLVVDVGLERTLECRGKVPVRTRVTVQLTEIGENLVGEIVDESKISIYWGYRVRQPKFRLGSLIEKERFDLKIGTSRYGTNLVDAWSNISQSLRRVESVLVCFGSPRKGLKEMLSHGGKSPEDAFDFFINTVPNQNVATVRTEEAVLTSLAILNVMRVE